MDDTDREHLVTNIVAHAGDRVADEVQLRVIAYWASVDPQLGDRVAAGLGKANGSCSTDPGSAQAAAVVAARANRA